MSLGNRAFHVFRYTACHNSAIGYLAFAILPAVCFFLSPFCPHFCFFVQLLLPLLTLIAHHNHWLLPHTTDFTHGQLEPNGKTTSRYQPKRCRHCLASVIAVVDGATQKYKAKANRERFYEWTQRPSWQKPARGSEST